MNDENRPVSLVKRVFIFTLLAGFLIMGFIAVKRAMPEHKEERIFKAIKVNIPYSFEKRLGGLTILDSRNKDWKEKPSAADVLHRMDELEKEWGKKHLSIENSDLLITKDDNSTVKILIKTPKERAFIKMFFGI